MRQSVLEVFVGSSNCSRAEIGMARRFFVYVIERHFLDFAAQVSYFHGPILPPPRICVEFQKDGLFDNWSIPDENIPEHYSFLVKPNRVDDQLDRHARATILRWACDVFVVRMVWIEAIVIQRQQGLQVVRISLNWIHWECNDRRCFECGPSNWPRVGGAYLFFKATDQMRGPRD
jgi:hypothetical protein